MKKQLLLPDDYDVACPKLEAFLQSFSHHKLFLVFPSMYLNNPGSTFGHTFLRFDGDGESIMRSKTLNYAARTDKTDAVPSNKQAISEQLKVLNSATEQYDVLQQSYNIFPEKGHNSLRTAIGYGEQNNRQYIDLRFRPAFHDLLDAPQGYVDGAAINMFDARFKWFVNNDASNNLRLESLSLFNAASISPLQRWRKPLSWALDFRFDRTQMSSSQSVTNFISRGALGFSFKLQSLTPFALLTGEWNLSSKYEKDYSLLIGLQAGIRYRYKTSQIMASYEVDDAVAGFDLAKKITSFQWQYNLQVNHAFRVTYKRTQYNFFDDEDWLLDYNYYF